MLRLRVGIGRPDGKASVERHVLGRFSRAEEPLLAAALQRSVDLLLARLAPRHLEAPGPAGGAPRHLEAPGPAGDTPREPAEPPRP